MPQELKPPVTEELELDDSSDQIEPDEENEIGHRKIFTSQTDPEVDSLFNKYQRGRLVIQPSYQRKFVWDSPKCSKLIESALLDIPIPLVYLSEEKDGKENDLQFEIFERLNTGSVSLNQQELRNCVYRGKFNELLKDMAADTEFLKLLGLSAPDNRMKDVELVLRFAAFYFNTYLNYKAPIKKFLNDTMLTYQDISDTKAQELRAVFKNSIQIVKSLLDKHAFKRYYKGDEKNKNGKWEPQKFNVSLYDILMGSFAKVDKNVAYRHLDSIREALIDLMTTDQEFIDSIELSTSTVKAVTTRFDKWRMTLNSIVGIASKEPRLFSFQLKDELFKADSTCAICGQKIRDIDDSAVDHIRQYWTGGQTIPENARLTHRYCNAARPRKEE